MRFDTLYLRFLQGITAALFVLMGVALAGCNSTNLNRAIAVYETIEQQREAERKELADKQQAEKDALEAAQQAEREKADAEQAEYDRRHQQALAGPHPPQYRDAANQAGHEYLTAGKQPPFRSPGSPAFDVLWKTPAHSLRETVILLARELMPVYERGKMRVVVAADPDGKSGIKEARVVAPYEGKHPAAYLPQLGQHYRPGPVFLVVYDGATIIRVYHIPDPGMRTGALR